jgi:hypothetical protein
MKGKVITLCGLLLFGIAPKSNQKSLENSIGLRKDYSSSANFLPPRAGKVFAINKGRICNSREFESGFIIVIKLGGGYQLV